MWKMGLGSSGLSTLARSPSEEAIHNLPLPSTTSDQIHPAGTPSAFTKRSARPLRMRINPASSERPIHRFPDLSSRKLLGARETGQAASPASNWTTFDDRGAQTKS